MKLWVLISGLIGAILLFGCTMIDVRGVTWIPWCDTLVEKKVGEHTFFMERGKWKGSYKEFCISGQFDPQ